jgi:hypothetical protein
MILSLIQKIASHLDFAESNPFHNGLFTPILRWVKTEQNLLKKMETGDLGESDRERIWEMVTGDFMDYRRGLKAAYLKIVEQTYQYAGISLPPYS